MRTPLAPIRHSAASYPPIRINRRRQASVSLSDGILFFIAGVLSAMTAWLALALAIVEFAR